MIEELTAFQMWQIETYGSIIGEDDEPEDPHADFDRALD
jgi:hypothetical protein